MKTGITQIIKTFFQQSFMTVVFAIPYLPRSMESGVRMEISGCRFKKTTQPLIRWPFVGVNSNIAVLVHLNNLSCKSLFNL